MRSIVARAVSIGVVGVLIHLCAAPVAHSQARQDNTAELKPGVVLDQSNSQLAKDLLPPEILKHYQNGDYKNRIVEYPTGNAHWEKAFSEATQTNTATLDVNDRGTIVYRATGQPLPYVYGLPFPTVNANDPKAAVKIVWNQFLAYWAGGSSYNRTLVTLLNRTGVDRDIVANGWFHFLDGQDVKYREPNPLNLQSQFLGVVQTPADLQGTASLTWRYRDADKHDSVWAFVPALRRVRAVSPANRSDGYLGSDFSGDDGFFFDGKPEDFEWKLVGQREGLRIVDPNTLNGPVPTTPAPGGGWVVLTDLNPPTVGYRTPGWSGAPWAPTDGALAKRSFWIVEGIPRDKYYLYGKLQLWIDAETWDGAWDRKFDWTGELIGTSQFIARVNSPVGPPDAQEWLPIGTMVWACAENVKHNRATLGGMRPDPKAASYRRMPLEEGLFDSTALQRFGK
ncbi:MAG: DUF1329 domain-containing protein [Candidatus Binatia bacterium]